MLHRRLIFETFNILILINNIQSFYHTQSSSLIFKIVCLEAFQQRVRDVRFTKRCTFDFSYTKVMAQTRLFHKPKRAWVWEGHSQAQTF